MVDLDALWRRRLELLVDNLLLGEQEHREIANLAEQIATDYHGRFLVELLQNANDQAVGASIGESTVAVVRAEGLLAVLNQGQPFDHRGLEDITRIGLSRKPPDQCLGNKGIGFKAVFEVSRSPEIYSAPRAGGFFGDPDATRFRLDLDPLSRRRARERARRMISEILEVKEGGLSEDKVLEEAEYAAPFKFPLPLRREDLHARLSTLGVSAATARRFQTMVVLPLVPGKTEAVDSALQAMVHWSGTTALFLDGVARIELHDRRDGNSWELGCESLAPEEKLDRGACLEKVRTWRAKAEREDGEDGSSRIVEERSWWRIRREIGSPAGVGRERSLEERERLRKALDDLPGKLWEEVERVPVAVALPRGDGSGSPGAPLGADGLLCIGLPTEQRTGSPLWLHSHFHGNISRTSIDLETLDYNRLLFDEGMRLLDAMLDRLRDATGIQDRRLVTLAMERSSGPVGDRLYETRDIPHADVVLDVGGDSYISPAELTVPVAEDLEMFQRLLGDGGQASDYGFVLPEDSLLMHAWPVLEQLAGKGELTKGFQGRLLRRGDSGVSLLERGAERNRSRGPAFWRPFLEWVVDRFARGDVSHQRILPVGSSGLLSPKESVFFPPLAGAEGPDIQELLAATDSIPDLPFFDERVIPIRKRDGGYTPLARKLAPEPGLGLVRRPEALPVINHALMPYMEKALAEPPDQEAALTALRLVLKLTDGISSDERQERIHRDRLRVPVATSTKGWKWISPEEAYLGRGWTGNERTDDLLENAFGEQERRLVSWARFKPLVGDEDGREAWAQRMRALGVSLAPKRRTATVGTHKAPLASNHRRHLSKVTDVPSPFPELEDFWSAYMEDIRHRVQPSTTSGQRFDVEELVWIDGLEEPDVRVSVLDLMLSYPEEYREHTRTVLGRVKRKKDRQRVPTMWVHALRNSEWSVVPTTQGRSRPRDAWLTSAGIRPAAGQRYGLLPVVRDDYRSPAVDDLLVAIGVRRLEETGAGGLVHALHQLARSLGDLSAEETGSARTLASDLYHFLQGALRGEEGANGLERIVDDPVPLLRKGDALEAVDLRDVDAVYLDDDPIRGTFVPDLDHAARIPIRARHSYGRLVTALRGVLGKDRVLLTSTVPVNTGFEPEEVCDPPLLCDELESTFRGAAVQLHLAAILAFCGRDRIDPEGERFREIWDVFQRTRVQRGRFPPSKAEKVAFFDRHGSDEDPVLQLSADAGLSELLRSTWQIFGPGHRDAIALYAQILGGGRDVQRFFRERDVDEDEFRRLREVIASGAAVELENAKGLVLALERRRRPGLTVDEFEAGWEPSAAAESGKSEIGGLPVDLIRSFGRAVTLRDEPAMIERLSSTDVSVGEWQAARKDLGSAAWRFRTSVQRYERARERLVAELMAFAARRPSVDPESCRSLVATLRQTPAPPDVESAPASDEKCRQAAIAAAVSIAEEDGEEPDGLMARRLAGELNAGESFLPEDIPGREVSDYRHSPQPTRSSLAKERLSAVLEVAEALAETKGETLDRETISGDPRVEDLTTGWLASSFALAPVLREMLAERVPQTAEALTEVGTFREPVPKPELWARFPEISGKQPVETGTRPTFTVFGESQALAEIHRDLASASEGEIGAQLRKLASHGIDLGSFRNRKRPRVAGPNGNGGAAGGGGGSTGSRRPKRQTRELNGIIGEAFVFEALRSELLGFDSTCWVSENRARYGHESGSDREGFDFLYHDVEGRLAGRKGALCEIEVKATSQVEPQDFTLTRNEWHRARSCHGADDREYVVVWVANVRDRPTVYDVLVDPFGLMKEGRLQISSNNLQVRVPKPDLTSGGEEMG